MSMLPGFGERDDHFDSTGEYVPDHLPDPGPFLDSDRVLTGEAHCRVHDTARELFEARGVYDMTFGYNLARLNRDRRHPDAGFRYAVEGAELRAEFTPTTPFCPQSDTLTVGAFRAWNGLDDRHGHDLVRIRVAPMHQAAESINEKLGRLEARYRETGAIRELADPDRPGRVGVDGIDHGDPAEDPP